MQQSWRDRAACRSMGPRVFFPKSLADKQEAAAACAVCRVSEECLHWVLVNVRSGDDYGTWAGTNKSQRARLRTRLLQEAS